MQSKYLILVLCGVTIALNLRARAEQARSPVEPPSSAPKYVRLTRDGRGGPQALETAIVRFASVAKKAPKITIDLIAAVHVGEKEYYQHLEREFDRYDVVLYELVGGRDKAPAPAPVEPGMSAVGMLQRGMKDFLQLHHQLDQINYSRTNFAHADMSLQDFKETMAKRGESFFAIFLKLMSKAMAEQNSSTAGAVAGASDLEILMALFSPDRALVMKRLMAEQFDQIESAINEINGPDGSTILTERNKVAMRVLAREIAAGRKRIAIFYGAAHMPDFETRLSNDLRMRRESERWIPAWDLRTKAQRAKARRASESNPSSPN